MHQSRKAVIGIFLLERYYVGGVRKVRCDNAIDPQIGTTSVSPVPLCSL
jgi:hypothetical protein